MLVVSRFTRPRVFQGKRALLYDQETRGVLDTLVRTKAKVVILFLRRGIHPPSLVTGKGAFLVIGGNDILTQFWAQSF